MLGLVADNLGSVPRVSHRFFGRWGGTSPSPWRGLNTSFAGQDSPARVEENIARVRFQVGVSRRALFTATQVHGSRVLEVSAGDDPEAVAGEEADALVTAAEDVAIAIRTADCVPILFAAADGSVVGAAHAGWRGAVGAEGVGIVEATLSSFERMGVAAPGLVAAIGPCIGWESFEVGPEVIEAAAARCDLEGLVRAGDGDRAFLDLGGYVVRLLERAGLSSVDRVPGSTAADTERFFSYRAERGRTGRQMSAIARTEPPVLAASTFA